jgi:predicted metal-dependent hydrolase
MRKTTPPEDSAQLGLPLTSTINTPDELLRLLMRSVGKPVAITLTDNRTRLVSFKWKGGIADVRLHHGFLNAPALLIKQLADWMKHPKKAPPEELRSFVASLSLNPVKRRTPRKRLVTIGQVHNLTEIYKKVNAQYFKGCITAKITYGRDTSSARVRTRRLGSYSHKQNLIVIHPLLDSPEVPEYVIAFTVFHEMLHALQPANYEHPHDALFRRAERAHPDYQRASDWRKAHSKLLSGGAKPRAE